MWFMLLFSLPLTLSFNWFQSLSHRMSRYHHHYFPLSTLMILSRVLYKMSCPLQYHTLPYPYKTVSYHFRNDDIENTPTVIPPPPPIDPCDPYKVLIYSSILRTFSPTRIPWLSLIMTPIHSLLPLIRMNDDREREWRGGSTMREITHNHSYGSLASAS